MNLYTVRIPVVRFIVYTDESKTETSIGQLYNIQLMVPNKQNI